MRGIESAIGILGRVRALFPLTARGVLVATLASLALTYVAYGSLDFVVLTLAYAALGLVGLGLLAVLVGAIYVKVSSEPPTGELKLLTDRFLPSDLRLPSLRFVPLLELDVALSSPRFERRREGDRELLRATHRGVFEEVVRELVVRDAFGLAEVRFTLRGGGIHALPHLGALEPAVALLSHSAGDDLPNPHGTPEGDRVELRRYVAGDPARFIHWKIYARTGELIVRMPEHALRRADRVAVYFVAGEGDEASSAVCLAIARAADLESKVILGCDGTDHPIRSVAEAERAVARSYGHTGPTAAVDFVRRAEAGGPAALLLVVPARPGPWVAAVGELVRGRPGGARVLVGLDGIEGERRSFIERVMFKGDPAGRATPAGELSQVVSALRTSGAEVILMDRASGRMLEEPPRRRAA